jgi:threonine dehydrogenase-like Zn-dependent dehydrogenase
VVGDGAVGLLGVLSVEQMGAKRIIAMSCHASRQKRAREFGATGTSVGLVGRRSVRQQAQRIIGSSTGERPLMRWRLSLSKA